MPRISKAAKSEKTAKRDAAHYTCTRCGRLFAKQRGNFPSVHSPLYIKNSGFLTVCGECVDEMFKQYSDELGGDVPGAERTCMKFDIYWDPSLYEANKRVASQSSSIIRSYIAKLNLYRYTGKTYDNTLRERAAKEAAEAKAASELEAEEEEEKDEVEVEDNIVPPTEEVVKFWGSGYSNSEYSELEERFAKWTGGVPIDNLSPGAETLYRQICVLELVIKKNANAGKPIEQSVNQLNNLIGSVNAKPTQQAKGEDDESFDGLPFGVGIRIYENTKPIPKPRPEYQDVDGIIRYILIWVFGHLCKLFHIKNAYSKLYEEEMERLRVERPDVADEDDEDLLYDVFGDLKRETSQ